MGRFKAEKSKNLAYILELRRRGVSAREISRTLKKEKNETISFNSIARYFKHLGFQTDGELQTKMEAIKTAGEEFDSIVETIGIAKKVKAVFEGLLEKQKPTLKDLEMGISASRSLVRYLELLMKAEGKLKTDPLVEMNVGLKLEAQQIANFIIVKHPELEGEFREHLRELAKQ